jgi:hypothetical protein
MYTSICVSVWNPQLSAGRIIRRNFAFFGSVPRYSLERKYKFILTLVWENQLGKKKRLFPECLYCTLENQEKSFSYYSVFYYPHYSPHCIGTEYCECWLKWKSLRARGECLQCARTWVPSPGLGKKKKKKKKSRMHIKNGFFSCTNFRSPYQLLFSDIWVTHFLKWSCKMLTTFCNEIL